VLRGPTPDSVQGALTALNDRICTRGEPAVLVVFYSGHADALALHLGGGALALERLEQLVRGSAATLRLLIVDACRSGALTRSKGGLAGGWAVDLPAFSLGACGVACRASYDTPFLEATSSPPRFAQCTPGTSAA
jgi:hypothetical protein